MRLLYLPNEPTPGWQAGPREALATLQRDGTLAALEIYSFLQAPPAVALRGILETARRFEPDAVLFTRIGEFPVTADWFRALKAVRGRPLLAYLDGDVYGRVFKRLSPGMRDLCQNVDVCFLCGLGSNAALFERLGARRIVYARNSASATRFGGPWTPTPDRELDVVMLANRHKSRHALQNKLPFARMPGIHEREQLVLRLSKLFGSRFAVFGIGWEGFACARGPVPFDRQHEVIQRSWLSVGYNHFPKTPLYFSDRLPIALLAGVAHVVNYHPGYETLFENGRELMWGRGVDGVFEAVRFALGRRRAFLRDLGARGRAYALANLTEDVVYRELIDVLAAARGQAAA